MKKLTGQQLAIHLIKWLLDNGHAEGAEDIRKMLSIKSYGNKTRLLDGRKYDLEDSFIDAFMWDYSDLGHKYWSEIEREYNER